MVPPSSVVMSRLPEACSRSTETTSKGPIPSEKTILRPSGDTAIECLPLVPLVNASGSPETVSANQSCADSPKTGWYESTMWRETGIQAKFGVPVEESRPGSTSLGGFAGLGGYGISHASSRLLSFFTKSRRNLPSGENRNLESLNSALEATGSGTYFRRGAPGGELIHTLYRPSSPSARNATA